MSAKTWAAVHDAPLDVGTHLNAAALGGAHPAAADDTALDLPRLDVAPPDPDDAPIVITWEDAAAEADATLPFAELLDEAGPPDPPPA
jgi:hypothetical protein